MQSAETKCMLPVFVLIKPSYGLNTHVYINAAIDVKPVFSDVVIQIRMRWATVLYYSW